MSFKNLSQALKLVGKVDLDKLAELSEKVDVERLLEVVSNMDEDRLQALLLTMEQSREDADAPPEPDGDFYDLASTLEPEQRALCERIRAFMEAEVEPIVAEHWENETFPRDIIRTIRRLGLLDAMWDDDGSRRPGAAMTEGVAIMELARVDPSIAAFVRIQMSLTMMSVHLCGDEAQKREWLPKLKRWDVIGAFGLAEPEVGSSVGQGLHTTCRLDGDAWVLDGHKSTVGNATFADVAVIWATDVADGEVQAFLVPTDSPGFRADRITGQVALRALETAHVTLEACRVPDSHRLQGAESIPAAANVVRATRGSSAWLAVGAATGTFERTLKYAQTCVQHGRPFASSWSVQSQLVQMLADVTAMQQICTRLSYLQDTGAMRDEQGALAELWTGRRCRDVVARAREVLGERGLLLENDDVRFLSDVEAISRYGGTHEDDGLLVGRAITGVHAFR